MAIDLKIDPEKFLKHHSGMLSGHGNASAVRLLHYPPLKSEQQNLKKNPENQQKITRCGKHTDYGGLTLLFQVRLLNHKK